jgi:hypothetical protein
MYFQQCRLRRQVQGGCEERMTWLPEQFAVVGSVVKLRNRRRGTWTDGWVVEAAGGPRLSQKLVVHQSHAYTRQRAASDI